ncbi:STAS domain-containing protein [Streptomyces sp. NPDC004065]|uniref:STAS domain-containing protein n=1 Tax=Streptomyces sp. NPDC004065 TaxID=3364689 RepID=UPI00384EECD7
MAESAYGAQSTPGAGAARDGGGRAPATPAAPRPAIDSSPAGDRVVVTVRGELDLDSGQEFQRALRVALARSGAGVDLDLGGVVFCDCSALNILISLRHRALAQGKTVVVRSASPVSERLLALSGTLPMFRPAGAPATAAAVPPARGPGAG